MPSPNLIVPRSSRYGDVHDDDAATVSAYARLRLQKPDWSQVLKFSRFTAAEASCLAIVDCVEVGGELTSR
jgi:hypothetical protein